MAYDSYPEITIAIGIDIIAQMKIKSCIKGFKKENGNVWVKEATIENFATAKLIFDWALIRDPRTKKLDQGQQNFKIRGLESFDGNDGSLIPGFNFIICTCE